ncbi:queuosine precursor transporter [Francisella uliginis]|uniref:Queuosine precursor transporter n=1 Tax=Francisella uliginis TaxID=573570 RepID=A0A1L4BS64_9GAMM|nr:queuosine precursor transporter [Francisella uliginis]API86677.1 hypothetical protein F7310_04580 [Francisella uliginis]
MSLQKANTDKNTYLTIFGTLNMLFIVAIIMADLLTYKLVDFIGFTATLGIIIYPLSYTVSDIITECFGKSIAIRVMIVGLIIEVLLDYFLTIASHIPNVLNPDYADAFLKSMGGMGTIATGSLVAALFGYFTNILIMSGLKKRNIIKSFFKRSVISSICGETIFICVGYTIWFYGTGLSMKTIFGLMMVSLVSKVIFSLMYSFLGKYIVTHINNLIKK